MSKLAAHVHSVRRALSLLWELARHTNLSRTIMVLPGAVALAGVLLEIGRVHGLRLIAEALTSPAANLLVAGLLYAVMRVAVIARGYVQPVLEETLRIVLRGKLRTLVMSRSLAMPLRSLIDRSAGDLVQSLESRTVTNARRWRVGSRRRSSETRWRCSGWDCTWRSPWTF